MPTTTFGTFVTKTNLQTTNMEVDELITSSQCLVKSSAPTLTLQSTVTNWNNGVLREPTLSETAVPDPSMGDITWRITDNNTSRDVGSIRCRNADRFYGTNPKRGPTDMEFRVQSDSYDPYTDSISYRNEILPALKICGASDMNTMCVPSRYGAYYQYLNGNASHLPNGAEYADRLHTDYTQGNDWYLYDLDEQSPSILYFDSDSQVNKIMLPAIIPNELYDTISNNFKRRGYMYPEDNKQVAPGSILHIVNKSAAAQDIYEILDADFRYDITYDPTLLSTPYNLLNNKYVKYLNVRVDGANRTNWKIIEIGDC
jgi:hypothetical protein